MSWAARRRFIILLIMSVIGVALFAAASIFTFYKPPTCTDGRANGNETGIDCGGSCKYVCMEQQQQPIVLFTKIIKNDDGRIDVIAKIENKNLHVAAKAVPYSITFDGNDQVSIKKVSSVVDLPPGTSVPVFIPGAVSDNQDVTQNIARAFLEIDSSHVSWFQVQSDTRIVPTVSTIKQSGTKESPRIFALLTNPSTRAIYNIKVIAIIYNESGNVIAASSTIIPKIYPQNKANIVFTWNKPFTDEPTRIEIIPVIPI